MAIVEDFVESWSYWGILVLLLGMNISPVLMPPSWLVLASFYVAYPSLDPLYLSFIGATGATAGRFLLTYISSIGRRFISEQRKTSLDTIGKYLKSKRYGYFLISFIFAIGPLPSNVLFITYGIIKARTVGMFAGFWLGRVVAYFVMISISPVVFRPFIDLFTNQIYGIILFDSIGILSVLVFASIDWQKLIIDRKLVFIRPRFRK
ncbi:MAG: hypothetical protein ACE5KA_06895 [Nitrososphaerales archaeon]